MNCPHCGTALAKTVLPWDNPGPRPVQLICMKCPERFYMWNLKGALVFLEVSQYEVLRRERHFARMLRWLDRMSVGPKN